MEITRFSKQGVTSFETNLTDLVGPSQLHFNALVFFSKLYLDFFLASDARKIEGQHLMHSTKKLAACELDKPAVLQGLQMA